MLSQLLISHKDIVVPLCPQLTSLLPDLAEDSSDIHRNHYDMIMSSSAFLYKTPLKTYGATPSKSYITPLKNKTTTTPMQFGRGTPTSFSMPDLQDVDRILDKLGKIAQNQEAMKNNGSSTFRHQKS